jgi:glucose-1-phosphate adenylyltransferase
LALSSGSGRLAWLDRHPSTYALGIGTSEVRARLDEHLTAQGMEPATVVHPGAWIGPDVRLGDGVVVYDRCTVTTNVDIGRHSKIKRAILDKNVRIPEGTTIGYDLEEDKKRYYVTESGIVVVEGHRSHVELATMSV